MSEIPLSYPTTHTFNTDTFEPTNVMAERIEIIEKVFPNFFKGERLLDCACNKGLISFRYANNFKEIVGFDVFIEFIDYCKKYNKFDNIMFEKASFREFWTNKEFDKVFIGNAHHYFYKENEGWQWIDKLATLVKKGGEVLIEGPFGLECKDMDRVMTTDKLKSQWDKKIFFKYMDKYFDKISIIPTVSHTPDRYLMLFKRKEDNLNKVTFLKDLHFDKMIKYLHGVITIIKTRDNKVVKLLLTPPNTNNGVRIFMRMAALSPLSNGMESELFDYQGNYCGWIEKYSTSKIYNDGENQLELFKQHCNNQIELAKFGFFDLDPATINFFKNNNKNFDKGAVIPIKQLDPVHWELPNGTYFKIINRCYIELNDSDILEKISKAMESRYPGKIIECYEEILNEI